MDGASWYRWSLERGETEVKWAIALPIYTVLSRMRTKNLYSRTARLLRMLRLNACDSIAKVERSGWRVGNQIEIT